MSGLVGSDGLVKEWPGQPAGHGQPACRVTSDAERLADEKLTGPPATNTMTRKPKPPTNSSLIGTQFPVSAGMK
ncbi:hypothetical protein ACTXG6_17980 [Pseudonocardia sp. Cha107L01]|uniref:hypothetical protein n=1 Tax=Pseudonocardia sp. Cha107L01 TaxID=3457576 RepID=UPI00403E365A